MVIVACHDPASSSPLEPTPTAARVSAVQFDAVKTVDDILEEIGSLVPGFGGLYIEQNPPSLVIYLTNPAAQSDIARGEIPLALRGARGLLAGAQNLPMTIRQGRFTFAQLAQWHRALNARGLPDGMAFTGFDKATNSLTLGVRSTAARSALVGLLATIGVPADAYSVETVVATEVHSDLTNRRRPTIGGIQTGAIAPCTLGVNVTRDSDPGQKYLLTASHCTKTMLGADPAGTDFFQNEPGTNNVIGREAVDPAPSTGQSYSGVTCPAGKVCRWGDAALIKYNNPADAEIGTIAMANASGTITGFAYLSNHYASSGPFYKTGIATGTSSTSTITWCVNYFPDPVAYATQGHPIPDNLVFLCQLRFQGFQGGAGDSGGPVFAQGLDCGDDPENPPPTCTLRFDKAKFWSIYHSTTTLGSSTYRWVSDNERMMLELGFYRYAVG